MKSIPIKSNNEGDNHISDLQNSILVQELIAPDMVSKCLKNDTSSGGKGKYLAQNVIEKKNEDCLRDADGHKLCPLKLYCLSKI